jgi:hypothetical protein
MDVKETAQKDGLMNFRIWTIRGALVNTVVKKKDISLTVLFLTENRLTRLFFEQRIMEVSGLLQ